MPGFGRWAAPAALCFLTATPAAAGCPPRLDPALPTLVHRPQALR